MKLILLCGRADLITNHKSPSFPAPSCCEDRFVGKYQYNIVHVSVQSSTLLVTIAIRECNNIISTPISLLYILKASTLTFKLTQAPANRVAKTVVASVQNLTFLLVNLHSYAQITSELILFLTI